MGTRPEQDEYPEHLPQDQRQTDRRQVSRTAEDVVARLNEMMSGWANYFTLGRVSPAYKAGDRHATRRRQQWFRQKHKLHSGGHVRFFDEWLWQHHGLVHLVPTTRHLPRAKA